MADQIGRGRCLLILCGLFVSVGLMEVGEHFARAVRHIVREVPGRLDARVPAEAGTELPVLAAIEEWVQAVAPLMLLALLWLLVQGEQPRQPQTGRTVTCDPEPNPSIRGGNDGAVFDVWSAA